MQIQKSHKVSKRFKLLSVAAVLIIAAGTGAFFYFKAQSQQNEKNDKGKINSIDYGPPTKEQVQAGEAIDNPNKPGSDPLPDPTPQENGKSIVNVAITSVDQDKTSLRVSSLISTIDNSGTCTLTLTKGSTKVVKEVGVQALPSSSTCKGFTIPVSELSTGKWQLTLTFENASLTGTADQSIEIK